jgi:hypothetical protein
VVAGLSCASWAGLWVPLVRFSVSVSKVENIFDFPSILAFDRHKYLCVPELYIPPMFNLASGGK